MTGHYLNPVVPENYTNTGTLGDFSLHYQRDFTLKDRLSLSVRHESSNYDLPNEYIQQTFCYAPGQTTGPPCQRQTADNVETIGTISYQHTFSSNVMADIRAMVRDNANDFNSNDLSNPIELFQHNWFREGYAKASMTVIRGRHEIKFGVESDNTFLNENFRYAIERGSAVGSLSTVTEPAGGGPEVRGGAVLPFRGFGGAFLLRPRLPDAFV
jgi:hypothetical protein